MHHFLDSPVTFHDDVEAVLHLAEAFAVGAVDATDDLLRVGIGYADGQLSLVDVGEIPPYLVGFVGVDAANRHHKGDVVELESVVGNLRWIDGFDVDHSQRIAVVESVLANGGHLGGNRQEGKAAPIERVLSDGGDTVGDGDGGQAVAMQERPLLDGGNAVGDDDGGQAAAVLESADADGGQAVGDGQRGQALAIIERFSFYRGHAVGNVGGDEACAVAESMVLNGGQTVGENH